MPSASRRTSDVTAMPTAAVQASAGGNGGEGGGGAGGGGGGATAATATATAGGGAGRRRRRRRSGGGCGRGCLSRCIDREAKRRFEGAKSDTGAHVIDNVARAAARGATSVGLDAQLNPLLRLAHKLDGRVGRERSHRSTDLLIRRCRPLGCRAPRRGGARAHTQLRIARACHRP
eukprot:3093976-Prymnesium_polylepis.3